VNGGAVVISDDVLWVAMRLARDVEACRDLLDGVGVDESRLDPAGLAWALQMRFVRIDVAGVDFFFDQLRELERRA
jgi:hypothetical protein